jgi:NADPH:quinone reductase-like Zn-dependent oxidoreductase
LAGLPDVDRGQDRDQAMKAFVRERYGSPEVLALREMDKPVVKDDEVLVRIRAASLNQGDLDYLYGRPFLTRMGIGLRKPRNRGLGFDAAGQVEAVGTEVTRFRPGEEVFGDLTQFGHSAFAEYVSAPERAWASKPSNLTFGEAATIPQAAILALQSLRGRRQVAPGDRVLVNGASGSVGPFAVQIAKAFGAHVTGVCSPTKLAFVRSMGADEVIDYTRQDYTRGGLRYDWIVDVAGNRSILECRRALKPRGAYVMVGGSTSRICGCLFLGPVISLAENKKLGFLWWKPFKSEDVVLLKELIEAGRIKPVIDRTYPLAELPDALRYLEAGHALGKIVIAV